MPELQPLPVGQRPRCLHCQRELAPNYDRPRPPLRIPTGETFMHHVQTVFGTSPVFVEEEHQVTRTMTTSEARQWRREHPARFLGHYGRYRDNRFCGLTCAHQWAVRHSTAPNLKGAHNA